MKTKIRVLMAIVMVVYPSFAYSDTDDETTPKTYIIEKGEKAPFDGVLLNKASQAKLIAEKKEAVRLCNLEKDYLLSKKEADCQRETKNLQIDLNLQQRKYDSIYKIKDEEIKRLNKLALKNPNSNSHWWVALGVAGGIAVTVASFLLVSQVRKAGE